MADRGRRYTGGAKSPSSDAKSSSRSTRNKKSNRNLKSPGTARSTRNLQRSPRTDRPSKSPGRKAKSPGRNGKTTGNVLSDRDKRKLDQELKRKYDGLKKEMAQERRKFDHDKKAMENEIKKFQREKSANDRLKSQIKTERDAWVQKYKKQKGSKSVSVGKINAKLKEWVSVECITTEHRMKTNQFQGEMKQESSIMAEERKQLKIDREQLAGNRKEFDVKCNVMNLELIEGEAEQSKLQNLEKSHISRKQLIVERNQEYDRLSELLIEREHSVVEEGSRLKTERVEVDELKKSLHLKLAQKRVDFVRQLSDLSTEVVFWSSSFTNLFEAVGLEVGGDTKQEGDDIPVNTLLEKSSGEEAYPPLDAETEAKVAQEYETMKESVH